MNTAKLESFLTSRLPEYLNLLERMVRTNSYSLNPDGVRRVAEITTSAFATFGFTAETVPCTDERYGSHLFISRRRESDSAIVFVSHLDTVFSQEEENQNNFSWRVDGARIYGPGTMDIKGGTVVVYMMLDALRALSPEVFERTDWLLGLNAAEEPGVPDFADRLKERTSKATKACLVFESGKCREESFRIVTSRKGRVQFRIEVEGRAAHSGTSHERGANAVREIARIVESIEALTNYDETLTCNVGVIGGGEVSNRVPHSAWAIGEIRSFRDEPFERAKRFISELAENPTVRSVSDNFSCRVKVSMENLTAPWPPEERSLRLFNLWRESARELGVDAKEEARGGLSDANRFWADYPTLDGLGPSGDNDHCSERSADGSKDQEYVNADSFVPKAMLNVLSILKLLGE